MAALSAWKRGPAHDEGRRLLPLFCTECRRVETSVEALARNLPDTRVGGPGVSNSRSSSRGSRSAASVAREDFSKTYGGRTSRALGDLLEVQLVLRMKILRVLRM